ncbi:MAG: hypothetical protein AAGE90_08785 [Pseudomonadota bacterium]
MQTAPLSFLRSRASRIASRLSSPSTALDCIEVQVDSGAMSGLRSRLTGSRITLGGNETNDVLLLDVENRDAGVEVTSRRSIVGPLVHIAPLGGASVTCGGTEVASTGLWERLPCRFAVDGVPVTLDASRDQRVFSPYGLAALGAAAAAVALVLMPEPKSAMVVTHAGAAAETAATPLIQLGAVELEGLIAEAGLSDFLSVVRGSGGTVDVTGNVPTAWMPAWRELRMDWDSRADIPTVTSRVSELKGIDRLPPIAAVRLGPEPYILLASGEQVRTGDILTEGWKVERIQQSDFSLIRNRERIEIAF